MLYKIFKIKRVKTWIDLIIIVFNILIIKSKILIIIKFFTNSLQAYNHAKIKKKMILNRLFHHLFTPFRMIQTVVVLNQDNIALKESLMVPSYNKQNLQKIMKKIKIINKICKNWKSQVIKLMKNLYNLT
jgi:hypothetical protein